MARKTVEIANILEFSNNLLMSRELSDEFKKGVAAVIEFAMFQTDTYAGFNYPSELNVEGKPCPATRHYHPHREVREVYSRFVAEREDGNGYR